MKEVVFKLNIDDYVAFNRYHAKQSSSRTIGLIMLVIVYCAWILFMILDARPGQTLVDWLVLLAIPPGMILILFFGTFLISRREIARQFQGKEAEKTLCETRIQISPEAITQETDFARNEIRWKTVEKIAIAKEHLFVFLGKDEALIIPKRAFADAERFAEFAATSQQYHHQFS